MLDGQTWSVCLLMSTWFGPNQTSSVNSTSSVAEQHDLWCQQTSPGLRGVAALRCDPPWDHFSCDPTCSEAATRPWVAPGRVADSWLRKKVVGPQPKIACSFDLQGSKWPFTVLSRSLDPLSPYLSCILLLFPRPGGRSCSDPNSKFFSCHRCDV